MKNIIINVSCVLLLLVSNILSQNDKGTESQIPVSTKLVLDAAGETGRSAINSVYLIACPKTDSKGTGFLIRSGNIITNEHVIRNNRYNEIFAISPYGKKILFKSFITDPIRDLAVLIPTEKLEGGLQLASDDKLNVGSSVNTWGFPLGYNGPAPLLSVGYLSGFNVYYTDSTKTKIVKHLVVNGAFNPGNSGGPLFISNTKEVIVIVVSKHAPMSEFHKKAIEKLSTNTVGTGFTAYDEHGRPFNISETQLLADFILYFRKMTQVMIGEAISISELKDFLKSNNIKY